jgi:hypothetical protein
MVKLIHFFGDLGALTCFHDYCSLTFLRMAYLYTSLIFTLFYSLKN